MKNIGLLFVLISLIMTSCRDNSTICHHENIDFPIAEKMDMKFEYFYTYPETTGWPIESLNLVMENLVSNEKNYSAFYYDETFEHPSYFNDGGELIFNFLPIRKENNNYFELRYGEQDVLILKDGIQVGDSWESIVPSQDGSSLNITNFEVVDKIDALEIAGQIFSNVFKVKETLTSDFSPSDEIISYHYYNTTHGIVKREIPTYVSGTYGPITFNRIISN